MYVCLYVCMYVCMFVCMYVCIEMYKIFITCLLDSQMSSDSNTALWVRLKYVQRSKGLNSCEAARQQAMKEVSRVVTNEGTVIKTLLDGTAEVRNILLL